MARIIKRINRAVSTDPSSDIISDAGTVFASTGESDGDNRESTADDSNAERGTDGNGSQFVDPSSATGDSGSGSPTKRRGRKPGSRNRANRIEASPIQEIIVDGIYSIHIGLSTMLKMEELELTQGESEKLGKAVDNVLSQYVSMQVSEKAQAWFKLLTCGAAIYGPRVIAANARSKREKNQKVTPIRPTVLQGGPLNTNMGQAPPVVPQSSGGKKPNGAASSVPLINFDAINMTPIESISQ